MLPAKMRALDKERLCLSVPTSERRAVSPCQTQLATSLISYFTALINISRGHNCLAEGTLQGRWGRLRC